MWTNCHSIVGTVHNGFCERKHHERYAFASVLACVSVWYSDTCSGIDGVMYGCVSQEEGRSTLWLERDNCHQWPLS